MEHDEEAKLIPTSPRKPTGWGARHTVAVMSFWGFAMSYAMRFNLSMAIVAMVNRTGDIPIHSPIIMNLTETTCGTGPGWGEDRLEFLDLMDEPEPAGEFDWDEAEQGLILGSFFYGYVITQLPGGVLSGKYGGKIPLGYGLLLTAIFALLTPIAARTHTALLVTARIIQGLGEGVTTPAMHALLAKWAPPEERGLMASIAYAGTSFGTAATMIVSGYLIRYSGWPAVFYVIGATSLLWFALWTVLVFATPEEHPRISADELLYIQNTIGAQVSKKQLKTPWRKIFCSAPLWAILIAHTGHTWGLYTLLTELPTYMKLVLNFDMQHNSWMSALPYLVMWITAIVLVKLADLFVAKNLLRTVNVRKTMQIIAHLGAGVALIGASYSGCNRVATVTLLTIAVGLNGASFGGFGVNHVDISPNHASVLMGITNTVSNMMGFVAPYVAGLLINRHSGSLERWQIVFFIAAGVYLVDTIFYLIFASADEQSWNRELQVPELAANRGEGAGPTEDANPSENVTSSTPSEEPVTTL